MAGGVALKGTAAVSVARTQLTELLLALDRVAARGQADSTSTDVGTFLAAVVDPKVGTCITALQALQ